MQPPEPGSVADLPLFVSVFGEKISLYRDMAGQSLHRRGYRSAMHKASLNESAAAGLLLMAGWKEASHQTEAGAADFLLHTAMFCCNAEVVSVAYLTLSHVLRIIA